MDLKRPTSVGLTFGQLVSFIIICGGIIAEDINLHKSDAEIRVEIAAVQVSIQGLKDGKVENARKIEALSNQNTEQHQILSEKMDKMFDLIYNYQVKRR